MGLDYNISFDEIREDRNKLLKYIRDAGGPQQLADKLEVPHDTLNYWRIEKHNIMYEDYKDYKKKSNKDPLKEKSDNEVFDNQEDNITPYTLEEDGFEVDFEADDNKGYEYKGDHYLIETEDGTLRITEDMLKKFKRLYSGGDDYLTKKETADELGIPKKYLQIIKNAFDITHNDIEFTDEELLRNNDNELLNKKILAKRDRLRKKIKHAEYEQAIKENKKFRKKDYYTDKAIDKVNSFIRNNGFINNNISFVEDNKDEDSKKTIVINISDWHTGKLVEAGSIIGYDEGFNKNIYEKRINKYLKVAINLIKKVNPHRVLILDYGDGTDNPEANQYNSQQKYQDISYEEQFVKHVSDLSSFIREVAKYFPNLKYSKVRGNHSKGEINWDLLAAKMIKDRFNTIDNIEIDARKKPIKNHNIYNFNLVQMHGDNMPTKIDTPSSVAKSLGLINMQKLYSKQTYLVQGHLHHQAEEGVGYKRILLPSIVGGDDLSNNMMKVTSRPAQEIFIFKEGEGLTDRKTVYLD